MAEISNSDKMFLKELKKEFFETVSNNLVELAALLEKKDYCKIAEIAHDLKGTAGIFDLDEATGIAVQLQESALKKKHTAIGQYIKELSEYMSQQGVKVI